MRAQNSRTWLCSIVQSGSLMDVHIFVRQQPGSQAYKQGKKTILLRYNNAMYHPFIKSIVVKKSSSWGRSMNRYVDVIYMPLNTHKVWNESSLKLEGRRAWGEKKTWAGRKNKLFCLGSKYLQVDIRIFTELVLIAFCRFGRFANAECTANSELLSLPSLLSNGERAVDSYIKLFSGSHRSSSKARKQVEMGSLAWTFKSFTEIQAQLWRPDKLAS